MASRKFAVSYVNRCVVIKMAWGENRLNPDFITAMNQALDKAERWLPTALLHDRCIIHAVACSSYEDAKAVVTIGEGKHYCLGLDLDYLATASPEEAMAFAVNLQGMLLRILTFPLVTVAAINGG